MKSSAALLIASLLVASEFRLALPGYKYSFPRDHFDHPRFRTEWWYFTGNVRATNGHRFGYELTFFRHALRYDLPPDANIWDIRDGWMAHLALSDIDGKRFRNVERFNRSGSGIAGVDGGRGLIWNGNWQVQWNGQQQRLRGIAPEFSIDLALKPQKAPVIHGANGVSQKSAGVGQASHYISLTRIATRGTITVEGKQYAVEGLSWMDHEFFSHSMDFNGSGWDWFSLQFDDGSELMLYRLRRKDGSIEPFSSGTFIARDGSLRPLRLQDFSLTPGRKWKNYPIEWNVRVPSLGIDVKLTTPLESQELQGASAAAPTYWEGAIDIQGTRKGSGYLEMTGYAPVH